MASSQHPSSTTRSVAVSFDVPDDSVNIESIKDMIKIILDEKMKAGKVANLEFEILKKSER